MTDSLDRSPFTPQFERAREVIASGSPDAWPILVEFIAQSDSGLEALWLLEDFIYRYAPGYVQEMAEQAAVDHKFATTLAGVTALDGGPELDPFIYLQQAVCDRLGLEP